jgi:DNA-binding Lrp family transcriptional regulator
LPVFSFPKLQEYFVEMKLAVRHERLKPPIDPIDRRLVIATQSGLPLVAAALSPARRAIGISPEEVMARLARMLESGVIRRIGAVPNHYAIGYTANGMSVWDVPDERIDELGARVGALDFVTHCYHRPRRLPEWPLQPVCHGAWRFTRRSAGQGGEDRRDHRVRLPFAYDVLFSTGILKKTGLRQATTRKIFA